MALILAVNPGGRWNAVLARLARELPGHELVGADSCAVAIAAVGRRAPDLVLLPPVPEPGQAELQTRLGAVPGGVRTLDLPPLESEDQRAFADEVRQCLARPADAQQADRRLALLIPAAVALANWVRMRRATWTDTPLKKASRKSGRKKAAAPEKVVRVEPAPQPVLEPERPQPAPVVEAEAPGWREPLRRWAPRLAAAAVLLALAGVAITYLPGLRSSLTTGTAVFESGPAGSQVLIDGQLVGVTPLTVKLAAGPHAVEFRNGVMSRTTEVVVVARSRVAERVDWMAAQSGRLRVSSDPAKSRVLVDGVLRGLTPVTIDDLASGPHQVVIESSSGSVRRTVTILPNKTAEMSESIYPGWLAVFSPFEIEINEGTAQIRPDDRGRAMLSPGPHKLRFVNRAMGYEEVRTVQITSGDTTTLNLRPQTTLSVTATEPSEVWVDGARVGETPLANLNINVGTRVILVKSAAAGERQLTVTATTKPVRLAVDFSKPPA